MSRLVATRSRRLAVAGLALLGVAVLGACRPEPDCEGTGGPQFSTQLAAGSLECPDPPPCEDCGEVVGDPHMFTFDRLHYSLQTAAELVASRSPDGVFEVQLRQEPVGTTQTSGVTAVAMRVGGTRVTVIGDGGQIRVDGEVVELAEGETHYLDTGTMIHRLAGRIVVVGPGQESSVHLVLHPSRMGLLVDPPQRYRGRLEGLLGNADGDPANDVILEDGRAVASPTWDDLHPGLAVAWRVTGAITLFDYEPGTGPDTYWDPTFPERRVSMDDFGTDEQTLAEAQCRAAGVREPRRVQNCTFDLLVVGERSVVDEHAATQTAAGVDLEPQPVDPDAGGPPVGDGDAASPELADGAVTWSSHIEDVHEPRAALVAGGHVVVHARDAMNRAGVLVGLSAVDGSEGWRIEGVSPTGGLVAVADRVVAVAERGGPLAGPGGAAALVAIDPGTGTVIAGVRHDPDRSAGERQLDTSVTLSAVDDTVLVTIHSAIVAFGADDLRPRWERSAPGVVRLGPLPRGATDPVDAWIGWHERDQLVIALLDLDDGTIGDAIRLDGQLPAPGAAVVVDDDLVVAVSAGVGGSLVRLAGPGQGPVWSTELGTGQRAPSWLTVAGDAVVGYTAGSRITAFGLDGGRERWSAATSSFNNNGGQVRGDADGAVYLASFGSRAYLEAFGADGTPRWTLGVQDVVTDGDPGPVSVVGPVVGDGVVAVSSVSDRVLVALVPTGLR